MIDWESDKTEVLLNPKLLTHEKPTKLPTLKSHVWLATSGTTGRFKFVALSKKAILFSAQAVNMLLQSDKSDVWINTLPTFHVGGLGILARAFLSGAKVISAKWDPHQFYTVAKESCATLSALVPAQVYDLVIHKLRAPSSIRTVIVGGGILSRPLYEKANQLGWNLRTSYGLTECASQVATSKLEEYGKGELLPHVTLRINQLGLIEIQSPSLLTGYVTFDGEDLQNPKRDSWFQTEDRGEFDGKFLKVLGRSSDFIKIGGESVNLLSLQRLFEAIKLKHQITYDAAIIAVPDERLGFVIHLVSEKAKHLHLLAEDYNQQVLPFERIRQEHVVDKIPRTPLGKLQYSIILDQVDHTSLQSIESDPPFAEQQSSPQKRD